MRILLIEDDERLAERTAEYLRTHEAVVEIVGEGVLGLERAGSGEHDIVLLDLMLPGIEGLDLCRKLRQRSKVPVIMLSARGDEVDRIVGLEVGADDYLPKPFSPRELLARIRAVLRRHESTGAVDGDILEVGPLTIDRARRTVVVSGNACELTAYQFDLLWVLTSQAERVLSRNQLHAQVRALRGEPPQEFDPTVDRSIDVHMSKVRQAMAAADTESSPGLGANLIKTVRGVGYVLSADA
ncbi:Copper-sensing two-component system response regulator CpxR [Enhygromyxa salina]|uniref:Copper-sensing two-component system response regulator CpxR n=1 Tax=Enhygromyxa salina TaxID=215803 RepID=A0A0C1Z3T7_9BACT|nr:response regulator transcription factor [Enhygromyxa salina]KIG12314.1 Copper-sensing two-component system response regulator CpxR [Enhygromyxa salina]